MKEYFFFFVYNRQDLKDLINHVRTKKYLGWDGVFYLKWRKKRHVYVHLVWVDKSVSDTNEDELRAFISLREDNKEPKWFNRTRDTGIDMVFSFSKSEDYYVGFDKEKMDSIFGKLLPKQWGSEDAVFYTFRNIIKNFGELHLWKLVKEIDVTPYDDEEFFC